MVLRVSGVPGGTNGLVGAGTGARQVRTVVLTWRLRGAADVQAGVSDASQEPAGLYPVAHPVRVAGPRVHGAVSLVAGVELRQAGQRCPAGYVPRAHDPRTDPALLRAPTPPCRRNGHLHTVTMTTPLGGHGGRENESMARLRESKEMLLFVFSAVLLLAGGAAWLLAAGRPARVLSIAGTVLGLVFSVSWTVGAIRRHQPSVDVIAVLALGGALAVGEPLRRRRDHGDARQRATAGGPGVRAGRGAS